ncbi:response regulator [Halomonas sp. TRM85114]|uniref:response regulator n=1 Tax=Halomonas jincaotanensis TaxID=2810616 RepID=UPI001BD4428D|nr:response regulator [Halomonas jincaotanensis]MBS9404281.1 response regulator [Halomonas jincaotanensis]
MRAETRKERLWTRLVKPLLWPVLTTQILLVALCGLVWLTLRWALPHGLSWSHGTWLGLALFAGSILNMMIFLAMLRQRLAAQEASLVELLEDGERGLADAERREGRVLSPDAVPDDPHERISRLLAGMRALYDAHGSFPSEDAAFDAGDDQSVLTKALESREHDIEQLLVSQQRAREESRLKSGYLTHLQQELCPLVASLDKMLAPGPGSASRQSELASTQALHDLHERLSSVSVLLSNLTGEAPVSQAAVFRHRKPRVLIVDDGPVNLMLARQVLEGQGLNVEAVTSGAEALERKMQADFDLVLMDIYMADMDGVATSYRWREREARRQDAHRSILVALTANASDEDRHRFRVAGMDDCLAKPYPPQALVELVRRWVPSHVEDVGNA